MHKSTDLEVAFAKNGTTQDTAITASSEYKCVLQTTKKTQSFETNVGAPRTTHKVRKPVTNKRGLAVMRSYDVQDTRGGVETKDTWG